MIKELKRAKFTFRLSAYTELLSTIRDGVSSLESLTFMSIDLEPKRRARSDVRFLSILRELSSSMYRAVTSSLACACNHKILMLLSTRRVDITPEHEEEEIIKDLKFRLALSSDSVHPAVPTDTEEVMEDLDNCSWEEILLQANTRQGQSQPLRQAGMADKVAALSIADPGCPMPQPAKKQRKTVNFASFRPSTTTTVMTTAPTATSTIGSNTISNPSQGLSSMSHLVPKVTLEATSIALSSVGSSLDLCGKLRKNLSCAPQDNHQKVDCYGLVFDPDHDSTSKTRRSYSVYPAPSLMPEQTRAPKVVSLRDVLEGKEGLPPLGYQHRLQLAVFIARSVLQLYKTP